VKGLARLLTSLSGTDQVTPIEQCLARTNHEAREACVRSILEPLLNTYGGIRLLFEQFVTLYKSRGAVEREFGRLKHEWAPGPLPVRGLDRVRLHADLTILAKLACALSRARAVPLAT
jgi:hypothetical protein